MKKPKASRAAALAAALPLIAFAQTAATLAPTTITATRFPDNSQSLPFGVSVISGEEIERSGASTVNEALMRVLGVVGRVDLWGGGEYAVDLRGFGSTADNNQVVIVDGIRLSEADLGGTRLAGIPIESVERIEVLRGSGSVLYGEGATGGVIVITTKAGAGKTRANGGSAYAGAGSYGLRDFRTNGNFGAGGFTVDAALQKRDSNGHRDNFRSRTEAGSLSGSWANEWLRVNAQHSEDRLDTGLPGALSSDQYAQDPRQTNTPGDHANFRNARTSGAAELQFASWQVVLEGGTRDKKLRSVSAFGSYDYDISADTWSLRARGSHDFGGAKNLLVVGTDNLRWTRDVLGAFGSTAKQDSRAWFIKDDVTLAGGTRIGAGWRTERAEKSNTMGGAVDARENAWELGASQPFGAVTAYARFGRSFRFANVDEFSFTAPGALLAPQTSRDFELGARWQHAAGKVEARLYRNDISNELGFDPAAAGPFGFFGANVNFDPTRRQGLEVDATHRVTAGLGVRVNANVRDATFRSGPYAGKDVPLVPQRTLAVRADWAPAPHHRVGGGVVWVGSQHPDFDNACTMPAYTTVDARYAYAWKHAEFSLGVTNLADRKFYTQAYACAGSQPSAIYPEPGRAFTAAVRVKF
ncbi:TonB-dependent receptor [Ramlibacter sp. PS4R-6]|uniref:TonB-dependent receptor n=1 Tax=Ramlibacter sp. PS4R-6 TaxID=3133438 RepID=UPI00309CC14C